MFFILLALDAAVRIINNTILFLIAKSVTFAFIGLVIQDFQAEIKLFI